MQKVMETAQSLAEAIVDSDVYRRIHTLEMQVTKDEAASSAIAALVEKRQVVENLLAASDMDHEALALAGQELEAAEKAMNEVPMVKELQQARQSFTEMMNNVNRILRLVITGETEEDEGCGGCSGSCEHCSGCH